MRASIKAILGSTLALVAIVGLYTLAAVAFALFPVAGRVKARGAATSDAFVCASAVHTDIVVALADHSAQWRFLFRDVAEGAPEDSLLAIGWGDYDFYHDTPTWGDLRASTLLRAFSGRGSTTIHVRNVYRPAKHSPCIALKVDRIGSDGLFDFIMTNTALDSAGRAIPQDIVTAGEAFYVARGRYGPFRTCNVWISHALAAAGQPTAQWAPFSFGVTWPLRAKSPEADGFEAK